ncbi:MAG: EamA family transporter [Acidobacteriota bacterium]
MKWALVGVIVACNASADLLNTAGMKRHGEVRRFGPRALAGLAWSLSRNPFILGGILSMAVAFFALLALLSVADLSFAVPATAVSYMLETLLAKVLLNERVDWRRWTGAALVASGVTLLAL